MTIQIKGKGMILMTVTALVLAASVIEPVLPGDMMEQASAATRPRVVMAATFSSRELDTAVGLFERFYPDLLEPSRPTVVGGRQIDPRFSPLRFTYVDSIGDSVTHLIDGLVSGETDEMQMILDTHEYTPIFSTPEIFVTSNAQARDGEGLFNSGSALIAGHIQRQTDALVRAEPFGVSVYLLFRSPSAPEQITFSTSGCPPLGFEMVKRLGAGTFAVEGLSSEDECEPFSKARIPAQAPLPPADTGANYLHEKRLLALAHRVARKDDADLISVVSAAGADDALGHPVPTDFAWRDPEAPVLRVHFKRFHCRYPLVARVDFVTDPTDRDRP
jgi:hypothetical protein